MAGVIERIASEVVIDDSQMGAAASRVRRVLDAIEERMGRVSLRASRTGQRLRGVARSFFIVDQNARGATGALRLMQTPAGQLGFIINDLQQFSFGAAQGIRAVSNNLGPLLATTGLSAGALGALVLTIEREFDVGDDQTGPE